MNRRTASKRRAVLLLVCCTFTLFVGFTEAQAVDTRDTATRGLTCEIKELGERPTLFVNGQPRFPMAYTSYYPQSFRYKAMGEHGVHVYSITLTLTDKWLGGCLLYTF